MDLSKEELQELERMEQEGIIGPANHAGKREILVPTEADIIER
jgi:S-DNA-T family DNA segregation ATPase FtsK/SpoIIIE